MNRETEFRGKRADNGEWVSGDLLINNGSPIIVMQVSRSYIGVTDVGVGNHWHIETPAYKVIPETVGMYTGLKDKHGKKIYEGDIMLIPLYGNVIVLFNEEVCAFQYAYHAIGKGTSIGGRMTNTLYKYESDIKYEVTGNIHDNPLTT